MSEEVKNNSVKAWVKAARPQTLSGAAVPVMIGASLAFKDGGEDHFNILAAALCFAFAFIMQIDANFINDYFDCKKGNDNETRLGPPRACSQGWVSMSAMRYGIAITTGLACLTGLPLVWYGGWTMILVGICCVLFCFLYTTTLSYLGLGDVLVLLFFGIVPVCLTYYLSHAGTTQVITPQVFLMSFSCGCVIDTLLVVNNFRDRENDLHSGKRTLITRIGAERGARLYLLAGLAGIILAALALSVSPNPVQHSIIPISFICLPYASLHVKSYLQMKMIWEGRALNGILAKTARNMLIYGLTASASFLFF